MAKPVPLRDLGRRLPEAGRIRSGRKVRTRSGKEAPAALAKFRFTSKDRASIEQVADIYGGQVQPWNDSKWGAGQWEVYTDTDTVRVALPPDSLGGTPIYELWSGGGCQRRCDGVDCTLNRGAGPDGTEPDIVDCLCSTRGELACILKTRLSVILPDVRLLGVWRLETGSQNAARELPGMVDAIAAMEGRGIQRALLRLVPKKEVVKGKTKHFVVPTLGFDATPDELAAGVMQIAALPGPAVTPPPAALGASEHRPWTEIVEEYPPWLLTDTVIKPEIVPEAALPDALHRASEARETGGESSTGVAAGAPPPDLALLSLDTATRNRTLVRARELAQRRGEVPPGTFEEITEELAAALMDDSLSRAGFVVDEPNKEE